MSTLTVAILGLGRIGASVGLALQRYMSKNGRYKFEITGYDESPDIAKEALKMKAVHSTVNKAYEAVADKDIVIMNLSYDVVEEAYRQIKDDLRDGVVILDASPLKRPSLEWSKQHIKDEHHVVGITPILNPKYLFKPTDEVQQAEEDLFDESAILITPAAGCAKEAVDLAFNFCSLLGSKPRFLDPLEHDAMLSFTDALPEVIGVALFYNLMHNPTWHDIKWFTNPAFGVLTRPLMDTHPDALRDAWLNNNEVLARTLDSFIETLQQFRDVIQSNDRDAVEGAVGEAAQEYEDWINHRYRDDWDDRSETAPNTKGQSFMGTLLGDNLAKRLGGKDDDDKR